MAALEQQVDVLTRERNSAAAQAAMYEGDLKEETARQSALLATRQGLELEVSVAHVWVQNCCYRFNTLFISMSFSFCTMVFSMSSSDAYVYLI